MQLISLPVSPFAARVRIALYAKELDVTVVSPPAGWPLSRHSLGPIGRVPVLICDDGVIPEIAGDPRISRGGVSKHAPALATVP